MSKQSAPKPRSPDWPTCTFGRCIGIRLDGQDACLAHADEELRKSYVASLRPEAPVDLRGTPISAKLLDQILAATQTGERVVVLGDVRFERAQFSGGARFGRARFSGRAEFGEARFSGDAGFDAAEFSGRAEFIGTRFSRDAGFVRAQFSGDAWFFGARFSGDAEFGEAEFSQAAQFGPVLARHHLDLDHARFDAAILINVTTPRLSCVAATFQHGVTLRTRYAEIVLDGSVFAMPSTLAYAEDTFRHPVGDPSGEGPWLDETPLHAVGRSLRPRLLSLRRVDVGNLVLAEVDLSACLFHGAHHLDQLRIEGTRSFAPSPGAWRLHLGRWWLPVWWRWSRRQTLAEEHHWRAVPSPAVPGRWARLARPAWHGPACQIPGWVEERTGQRVQQLGPERVAVLYRQLRKAQEDSKDEPGAADFYYGEMEMRRNATSTPLAERFILRWYWLLAGYSLRGLRAFAALLIVVAGLSLLLQHIGFNGGDPPLRDALIYTAQSTLSLEAKKALAEHVSWAGDVLRLVLRLSGPVLLGLALLSVRNRVKR
jgi:Pentapeptide repeats (9 copies)